MLDIVKTLTEYTKVRKGQEEIARRKNLLIYKNTLTLLKSLDKISCAEELTKFKTEVDYYGNLNFEVHSKEALHEVRELLRRLLGSWEDKCESISQLSDVNARALYRSTQEDGLSSCIYIAFVFPFEHTPEEFTKKGCHWERQSYNNSGSYKVFVCPVEHS